MKRLMASLAASLGILAAAPASAQFSKPEDAIHYRQSAFTVMGVHFSRIGAMVKGTVPFDAKIAADNAAIVETMAKLPWAAFGEGTDKGASHHTQPAAWKERAKFNQGAERMQAEVSKLGTAARSGNLDQLKSAFGSASQTCKSCHDDFRSKQPLN